MDHTKTPWFSLLFDYADRIGIFRDATQPGDAWNSAEPIAYIDLIEGNTNQPIPEAMANAEFIVKAVNSHEALLEAARLTADQIGLWIDNRGEGKFEPGMITCLDKLRMAIQQAKMNPMDPGRK